MKKTLVLLLLAALLTLNGCDNLTGSTDTPTEETGTETGDTSTEETDTETGDTTDEDEGNDATTPSGSYSATIGGELDETLTGPADFYYNTGNAPDGFNIWLHGAIGVTATGGTDGLGDVRFEIGKTEPVEGTYPVQYRGVRPDADTAWHEMSFFFVLDGTRYDVYEDSSVSGLLTISEVTTNSITGTASLSLEASRMERFSIVPVGEVTIDINFTAYNTD